MNSLMQATVLLLVVAWCHQSEAQFLRLPTTDDLIKGAVSLECSIRSVLPGRFPGLLVDRDGNVCKNQPDDSGKAGSCASRPCRNGGTCKIISRTEYQCTCPYPMGGKTCSDLICESCHREGDLVLFWNRTKGYTWSEAHDWCQLQGWHLTLDKDQAKHDLITRILKKEHPDIDEKVAYWIGLNRTSETAPWKYIDGTSVSSFQPWTKGRPQDDNCVEVCNGETFKWLWDDERCDGYPGWVYYPLCEKRFGFLKR